MYLPQKFRFNTDRLIIRFYFKEDYSNWQKLFNEMRLKQNQWDWDSEELSALTIDRFERKLLRHANERTHGDVYYFCVENNDGELVGISIINNIKGSTGEIGFQLNNMYWGKGLGYELAQGVLDISKNELSLETIIAKVNKKNKVSIKILEKLGMDRFDENNTQFIYEV